MKKRFTDERNGSTAALKPGCSSDAGIGSATSAGSIVRIAISLDSAVRRAWLDSVNIDIRLPA